MAIDARALLERFRLSPRDLAALRKSAVLRLWLKKSWSAWLLGICYSIFAQWIFPAMLRPVLRVVYPPTKGSGLVRVATFLNNSRVEDPRVDHVLATLSPVLWIFGLSLVMALLEAKVRPAIEAARSKSRTLEHEADAAMDQSPSKSVMLLRNALDYAVDDARAADLRRKMDDLDVRLSRPPTADVTLARPVERPAGREGSPRGAPLDAEGAPFGRPGPNSRTPEAGSGTAAPVQRRIGVRGRYRLEQEIARGGMGVVWRGFDTVLERAVAVKELPATTDPGLRDRFRQEALALARLSHPHVVQVYDFVEEEDERLYMAMELVEGGDLETLMRDRPPSLARALEIGRQVATGLGFAHKRGIVHRDVKPLNILLTKEGLAKVTDFGLARLTEASMHTVEGAVMGSPRYMSPEQAAGKIADARSDVYAFGATLFHLVTGRPPFDGDTASVLAQHITQPPPPPSSINPQIRRELDVLMGRMLAKDPAARPSDLDELAAQLLALR